MPAIASIDIGSNAMRLAVAEMEGDGKYVILDNVREPVRMGQDVFQDGTISEDTMTRALNALMSFRHIIDNRSVQRIKAVATSAVREAANRDLFVDRVSQITGIDVEVIGPEEEARLIYLGVKDRINLWNRLALIVDIGGGSVEISLATGETILCTESYAMGSVRLLQLLEERKHGERRFNQLVREYVDATERRLREEIGDREIEMCIGTGGSIEALGNLRQEIYDKNTNGKITVDELSDLVRTLQNLSFEDRVRKLGLKPDRADVIVPAALVMYRILKQSGVDQVMIPFVGLKEGLIVDVISEITEGRLHRPQALTSARQLGLKYCYDEAHAEAVRRLAVQIFDQTRPHHHMDPEARFLLEIASLLHDIGNFVNVSNHHKHSHYLIQASPLVGLDSGQMEVVANVARYHRRSGPKPQHENYRLMPSKQRVLVSRLASILRLADALDTEHAGRVAEVHLDMRKPKWTASLRGEGDMMLEKWAFVRKVEMFEQTFGVKIALEE